MRVETDSEDPHSSSILWFFLLSVHQARSLPVWENKLLHSALGDWKLTSSRRHAHFYGHNTVDMEMRSVSLCWSTGSVLYTFVLSTEHMIMWSWLQIEQLQALFKDRINRRGMNSASAILSLFAREPNSHVCPWQLRKQMFSVYTRVKTWGHLVALELTEKNIADRNGEGCRQDRNLLRDPSEEN